ncbi:MAG: toxin-activating lysine-acyltransferase [Hyphomicrobiales bacterium]
MAEIAAARTRVHEIFGSVAMAMLALPRYREHPIVDLRHLLLDPLVRDRVAVAKAAPKPGTAPAGPAGIAIWASVSAEVDAKIREQIKAGAFPVRLAADDWTSGEINWLLDVIAPNQRLATAVIANFSQVVRSGEIRMHPAISRLVDPEALKKMRAVPATSGGRETPQH